MKDIDKLADNARNAIDYMQDYIQQATKAFERIADLTRSADEDNWHEVIDEVFDIAYNNY